MLFSGHNSTKTNLKLGLTYCQNHIRTLNSVPCDRDKLLEWFRTLCSHLTDIITLISTHYKANKAQLGAPIQTTLLLYLTQIVTTLGLLINIFVREAELSSPLREVRNCVIKQIVCCLECIGASLDGHSLSDPSGNFVKWMDAALAKIGEIEPLQGAHNSARFNESRELFEEVLSHAMSIAQVALEQDSRSIRGGCQSVLQALASLSHELHSEQINPAMVNLLTDVCTNKLCGLERKVNTAVLKLCLGCFTQFEGPLERIRSFCFEPLNKRCIENLDGLVADFDLHVDRIMQIGLFAVSCSSDLTRGIKIRSCLASLEALESELVPSLTSALLDNSIQNKNCAEILMEYWFNQAESLKRLIFLIIDPFAFCQVVFDRTSEIVDDLCSLCKKKQLIKQGDVDYVVATMRVVQEFIDKAQNEFDRDEKARLETKLKDFNDVVNEVQSASKVLLSSENINFENCGRVLKRCKILLTVLKRVWYCFADDVPRKNMTIADKSDEPLIEPTGNVFLDHIINRGKQILQDRSVLYKSPIKKTSSRNGDFFTNKHITSGKSDRKSPLSKQLHLRRFGFTSATTTEKSLDLQITDLLNQMTNLSTTIKD